MDIVTAKGNVRGNAIISFLVAALLNLNCNGRQSSIITTGTGFSTPQFEIVRSAVAGRDALQLLQITGHVLIESAEEAISFFEAVVTLPIPLKEYIRSAQFSWIFPARRRFLSELLKCWIQSHFSCKHQVKRIDYHALALHQMEQDVNRQIEKMSQLFKNSRACHALAGFWFSQFTKAPDTNHSVPPEASSDLILSGICDYYPAAGAGTSEVLGPFSNGSSLQYSSREWFTQEVVRKLRGESWWITALSNVAKQRMELSNQDPKEWERYFFVLLAINPISSKQLISFAWTDKSPERIWEKDAGSFFSSDDTLIVKGLLNNSSQVLNVLQTRDSKVEALLSLHQRALVQLQDPPAEAELLVGGQDSLLAYILKHELIHLLHGYAIRVCAFGHVDALYVADLGETKPYTKRFGLLLMACKRKTSGDTASLRKSLYYNTNQVQSSFMYRVIEEKKLMDPAVEREIDRLDGTTSSAIQLAKVRTPLMPGSRKSIDPENFCAKLDSRKPAVDDFVKAFYSKIVKGQTKFTRAGASNMAKCLEMLQLHREVPDDIFTKLQSDPTTEDTHAAFKQLADKLHGECDQLTLAKHIQNQADDALQAQIRRYPVLPCSFIVPNTSVDQMKFDSETKKSLDRCALQVSHTKLLGDLVLHLPSE